MRALLRVYSVDMQIELDIPEALYEKLNVVAETDSTTVEQALVRLLERSFGYPDFADGPVVTLDGPRGLPRIHARESESPKLDIDDLNEYVFLP